MKYIKTFEQFVNESINESGEIDSKTLEILDAIDEVDDDIEEETESKVGAKAKLTKVLNGDTAAKSDMSEEANKSNDKAKELHKKASDLKGGSEDSDTEQKSYEAEAGLWVCYAKIYASIAGGKAQDVLGKMKELLRYTNQHRADLNAE